MDPRQLFRTALQQHLQDVPSGQQEQVLQALLAVEENLFADLDACTALLNQHSSSKSPVAVVGPAPAVLPVEPSDEELMLLQTQVTEVSQRVADYRSSVPALVTEELMVRLQASQGDAAEPLLNLPSHALEFAPSMQDAAAEPQAADATATAQASEPVLQQPLSPAPAQLAVNLTGITAKMPTIRAKLEEALERMNRMVAAVECDALQPTPRHTPHTGRRTPLKTSGAGDISPALKRALDSGRIISRKRSGLDQEIRPMQLDTVA